VSLSLNVLSGFVRLVLTLLCLVVLLIPVVALSCFVLRYLWLTHGVILMVVFCNVNFLFFPNYFVFVVFIAQTATLLGIFSLMAFILGLIPLYLLSLVVILIQFLIVPLIDLALTLWIHLVKAPRPS